MQMLVVLVVSTMIGIFFLPSKALAQQSNDAAVSATLTAAAANASFWTEARIQSALPMPMPKAPRSAALGTVTGATVPRVMANSGGPGAVPTETTGDTLEPLAEEPLFGTFPFSYTRYRLFADTQAEYNLFPNRLVGQLLFQVPGQGLFECSASIINSANNSVVWTAGHCVFSPGIGFHTNFLFRPGLRNGTNTPPAGGWTAKAVFTTAGWQNGFLEFDHGALVINRRNGLTIGQTLGFLGFLANIARQQNWHSIGYPLAPRNLAQTPPGPQFDGVHQELCAATFARNDLGQHGPATIGIGCDQTGGASGGPWVKDRSAFGGATNFVNGNNSYRHTGPNPPENLKLFGPYFTTGAVNLRNAAQAVPN
jgi:V8-like Glu-specific endopeptidase